MANLPGNSSVEPIEYMTETEFFAQPNYMHCLPIFPTEVEVALGLAKSYLDEHEYFSAYLVHVYQSRKKKVKNG